MHKRVRFPVLLLAVIAGFGIFHFIGGLFTYKGTLIYEIHIFKFGYDNFIHLVASFLYTIIGYSLLEPGLNDNIKKNRFYFGFLLFIFGFGIAAFGEIVELIGVLQVGSPGVGDYFNNAFDLVFNAIGALVASLLVVRHHWKKDLIKVRQSS
tara:strand:- start:179 stop:634 length:456 start_codon:yes stop_codon:yes gene_type:complete